MDDLDLEKLKQELDDVSGGSRYDIDDIMREAGASEPEEDKESLEQLMQRFADNGFAEKENERWRLTEKGWLVSNRIIVAINELQERSTPLAKKR